MPLVQHNHLPSIDRVGLEGTQVCASQELDPRMPELRVGFLNMMPDKAIAATERQFLRLLGSYEAVNCFFYPFTIAGIERSAEAADHIHQFYFDFDVIRSMDLHALVITGANVTQPLLINEPFWKSLERVLLWAQKEIRSTVCSCLATHAAAKVFYDIDRKHLPQKCWGVFDHEVVAPQHVLMQGVEGRFEMCHSRFNDVSAEALIRNDVEIIVSGPQVGVQLAADKNMKMLFFQGHPEYDDISLLKEYKREVVRFIAKQREEYPPVPENYFSPRALQLVNEYKQNILNSLDREPLLAEFPDVELQGEVRNQWRAVSLQIFKNWLQTLT